MRQSGDEDHLDRISSVLYPEAIVDDGAIGDSMRSKKVWQVACDVYHRSIVFRAHFQTK